MECGLCNLLRALKQRRRKANIGPVGATGVAFHLARDSVCQSMNLSSVLTRSRASALLQKSISNKVTALTSGRHGPRLEAVAFVADFSTGQFEFVGQALGIGVSAARDLAAANTIAGTVDDRQAQLAVTVLRCPGDALERFKSVSSDQECIVEAQWGVRGYFLKCPYQNCALSVGLTVQRVTCVDDTR